MSKQNEMPVAMNNVSQISVGTEIKGDILCGGDLRIDGKVEGKVHVKGKMVIGASGRVDGEGTGRAFCWECFLGVGRSMVTFGHCLCSLHFMEPLG